MSELICLRPHPAGPNLHAALFWLVQRKSPSALSLAAGTLSRVSYDAMALVIVPLGPCFAPLQVLVFPQGGCNHVGPCNSNSRHHLIT
jgi:hypothetical protein